MLLGEIRCIDEHQPLDACGARAFDHLIEVGCELFAVEVAMRIDDPHFRRAPTGMSSRKAASTGLPSSTDAAITIPFDSMPFSLRGGRFASTTTLRLMSCSAV